MRYTLFSLAFLTAICFTACDDSKEYGDGLEEKTLISEITLANVENGKLTLAASVDYMDSLIQCKIVPEQPTNRKVSWSSSDENVATVTQDGLVHAVSAGRANIVVTPEIGFGASTFFELTVVPEFIPIADFEFTDDDKKDLYVSEERSLRPTLLPAGHTYSMGTWKSSDESIATVTKEGVVRGVNGGTSTTGKTVTITAISLDRGGYEESFDLKIIPIIYVESLTFGEQEDLLPGESAKLNFTTVPVDATIASLKWSSSNTDVIEVNDQGVVTAKAYGEATITATTTTEVSYTTTVKVPYGLMKYSFDTSLSPWYLKQADGYTSSAEFKAGGAVVKMVPNPSKGNSCRADLVLTSNGSYKDKVYLNVGVYPYLAIKMIRPYGAGKLQGNIKLDTQYGAYLENSGSGSNKYTILDGAETPGSPEVYYYDLQRENAVGNGSNKPFHTFSKTEPEEIKTLQFVMADFKEANGSNTEYTVYWVRTFKTIEDLKAFVENENTNN